jgi:hypothetical protein
MGSSNLTTCAFCVPADFSEDTARLYMYKMRIETQKQGIPSFKHGIRWKDLENDLHDGWEHGDVAL